MRLFSNFRGARAPETSTGLIEPSNSGALVLPSTNLNLEEPRRGGQGDLSHLYETKTVSFGSYPGVSRQTGGWASIHGPNRAEGWDMDAVVAEGYERSPWIYRCVELISSSQARLPFRVARHRGTEDEQVILSHPLYRVLNKQANPHESARVFRKRLSALVLLSKRGAFIEVTKSAAGIITRLDLLDPSRVIPVPSDDGSYLAYYEYTRPDGTVSEIAPERVRWVREPHPTDPFCGTTPLEAAGISVELDQLSRQYNVSFIKNDSRPGGVLAVDSKSMTPQEMAILEARFQPGAHRAGHMSVVASGAGGVNYVDTTTRPRDMAYSEASRNAKDEILSAFGIGESLLGNASGRTFDNAEQEEYNFWTKPMVAHNDLIASAFMSDLLDEDLEPFLDSSGVEALEVGARRKREEALKEFEAGLRSINEYRPFAGLEPLANPQARALWISPQKAPVPGTPEDAAALLGGENGQAPAPEGGDPNAPDGGQDPAGGPGVDVETAAEAVEAARAEGTALDMSAPEGDAASAVADARGGIAVPEEGAAADAVAAARSTGILADRLAAGKEARETAAEAVQRGRAIETKSVVGISPVEYEPAPQLSDAAELSLNAALVALLAREEGVILARLESPKTRKGTPFWVAENAADTRGGAEPIDVERVVDAERWAEGAVSALAPVVQNAAETSAVAFLAALLAAGVLGPDVTEEDLPALAAGITRALVLAILAEFADAVLDRLAGLAKDLDGSQERAKDLSELVGVVRQHYSGGRWARSIAGDLGHALVTGATEHTALALQARDVAGATRPINREWVSRRDERVRPTHRAVDGTVLPLGEAFSVGLSKMLYPQDPAGPPAERYGCRCRCIYRIAPADPA